MDNYSEEKNNNTPVGEKVNTPENAQKPTKSFKAGSPGGGDGDDKKKNNVVLAITLIAIAVIVIGSIVYGLATGSLNNVMGTVLSVVLALLVLLAMITVHEFGHYVAGKALGFGITEFALGFGPAVYKKKRKNGEYFSVRVLPIGGFCAFEGEDDDSDSPTAFNNRKPWQRIIVLVAGAFMNFVLAIVMVMLLFGIYGQTLFAAGDIVNNSEYAWSLEQGDAIVSIEGKTIYLQTDLIEQLNGKKQGDVLNLVVYRNGEFVQTKVTLRSDVTSKNATDMVAVSDALGVATLTQVTGVRDGSSFMENDILFRECTSDYTFDVDNPENDDNFKNFYKKENRLYGAKELYNYLKDKSAGEKANIWVYRNGKHFKLEITLPENFAEATEENIFRMLGVTFETSQSNWGSANVRLGFFQTIGGAFAYSFRMAGSIFLVLGQLITGALGINSMGGTVTTIVMTTQVIKVGGLRNLLTIGGYIGVNLGVFNLLPLPALDGSRVVFTLIEWIRGKPVNRNVEAIIHTVGLFLLLGFAVLVDILHLF